jgi:uncharacterized protein YkwD
VPASTPARHRAGRRRVQDPGRGSGRRARYLLSGLLVLPVLTAGGFYLASAPWAGAPAAPGKVTALQTPATCGSVSGGSVSGSSSAGGSSAAGRSAGGSSVGGSCAGRPFRAAVASVPPAPTATRKKRPAGRPSPTASASSSPASSSLKSSSPLSSSPATPAPTVSATDPAGAAPGTPAAQVLALINQARSAAGLPSLTITAGLDSSASAHNLTMARGCGLSHQCPAEPDLGARETAAGVVWSACGENIGEGGPVADTNAAIAQMAVGLTQDMLNEKPPDDGHRRNILSSSFTHIGIAVHRDTSGTVWLTQDFSN